MNIQDARKLQEQMIIRIENELVDFHKSTGLVVESIGIAILATREGDRPMVYAKVRL